MFIPMGTVVALCMIITIIFANRIPGGALNRLTPVPVLRVIGVITGAAGLWNVLWYGLQHLGEFWGHMALGSGLLMTLLSALLVLPAARQPRLLNKLRPVLIFALMIFAFYYALTIYRL